MTDLLIAGGFIAVPGLPPLEADVLVRYDRPLLQADGVIADIGDMSQAEAQDTLRVDGLYLIPTPEALGDNGGLDVGAPAHFLIAEDPRGRAPTFLFEGGPPQGR